MKQLTLMGFATVAFSWGNVLVPASLISSQNNVQATQPNKLQYRPFSKRGQVKGSIPGGKRGACRDAVVQTGDKLVAIAPPDSIGASLSKTPTLWVYSPYTFPAEKFKQPIKGEFKVRQSSDAGGKVGESMIVDLPRKPGLVEVTITEPLKDGQSYSWSFSAKCGDASENPTVASKIEIAIDSKLIANSQSSSTQQKAASYAEKGYWYDALTLTLQAKPNVKSDIQSLLESGGLTELGSKLSNFN